jgi:hypothetical protein
MVVQNLGVASWKVRVCAQIRRRGETMSGETWDVVAQEAIDYLAPFGPVIMMGVENASRQLGKRIERKRFVNAKSVYAVLKTSFERNGHDQGRQLLEDFVKEPDSYRDKLVVLVAQEAGAAPDDLGRKLVAITNRLRKSV